MTTNPREASLRPFGKPSVRWRLAVLALGAVVAAGIVAWVVQLRGGMGVAGYNDHAFWAIYIADVITFIGVSYGGAVVSAILRLTGATWRAPLTRLAEYTSPGPLGPSLRPLPGDIPCSRSVPPWPCSLPGS